MNEKEDSCGSEDAKSIDKREGTEDCSCGYGDTPEDEVCGCEEVDEPEDMGCEGIEHTDESHISNPDKPKDIAEGEFIKEFEKYAHSLGIKSIGYTLLTPDMMIEDKYIQYPNAIVLTMEMDKKIINATPGAEAKELNDLLYEKFGNLTYKLSDYLRKNGFATGVAHPDSDLVNFSPLAEKAGLGFIGKSGLLITPELGPRLKISAIFVSIANLPVKDDNEHSWIPDYCDKCVKCAISCPENALIQRKTCFGGKEMEFIQRLCIGCSQGCTYCIANCPFDKKGYEAVKNKFDKMTAKLMEKKN